MNEDNQHLFAVVRRGDTFLLKKKVDVFPNQECPLFVSTYKEARKFWTQLIQGRKWKQ